MTLAKILSWFALTPKQRVDVEYGILIFGFLALLVVAAEMVRVARDCDQFEREGNGDA